MLLLDSTHMLRNNWYLSLVVLLIFSDLQIYPVCLQKKDTMYCSLKDRNLENYHLCKLKQTFKHKFQENIIIQH